MMEIDGKGLNLIEKGSNLMENDGKWAKKARKWHKYAVFEVFLALFWLVP